MITLTIYDANKLVKLNSSFGTECRHIRTLYRCLTIAWVRYIRYFHPSAGKVLDSIKPYKKVLDKQLWDDISEHLLSPK